MYGVAVLFHHAGSTESLRTLLSTFVACRASLLGYSPLMKLSPWRSFQLATWNSLALPHMPPAAGGHK